MRSAVGTKKRRNKRFAPQKTLTLPIPSLESLELPSDDPTREDTYPEKPLVNSGMRYESTLTRELKISANDVPVMPGSYISDFDGIAHTINKLTSACTNARNRLSWCGQVLREQEIILWQKDVQIANLKGLPIPTEPPPAPFFETETNPGETIVITKRVADRIGMLVIGSIVGLFGLMCVLFLLFA